MTNKRIYTYIGYLLIAVAIFVLGFSFGNDLKAPEVGEMRVEDQSVSLMIDYGNGQIFTDASISLQGTTTVFEVLNKTSQENNIELKYKDYGGDLGIFIESIGGVGKDPTGKRWWQFWVNNKYSQTGAGSYFLRPGDSIEFKFIEGQH